MRIPIGKALPFKTDANSIEAPQRADRGTKICSCHKLFVAGICPASVIKAVYIQPPEIKECSTCYSLYKELPPGYWGGNGKRGSFEGFQTTARHPNYCSNICSLFGAPSDLGKLCHPMEVHSGHLDHLRRHEEYITWPLT